MADKSRWERPETFAEWWQLCGQPYEAAVIKNGGVPWPMDPVRRAAAAEQLGLPADTDPMELRRALFERSKRSDQA
ncbi:hypothetical protein [[Mycobacterium] nativiensis]|uniref:Uncharacterized protein n=1 Tax=[Mycobacterium] nativiensis TaxID=2855503 RepID=A0ABU5XTD2_9MYCO|nr:hypothetical protein [Mycolicibacter sp. MYC340]MEB3031087.1 hypothetical protein [Mycolicibacter sp. MYC340]